VVNNPCRNNASCVTIPGGGLQCICPAGFTGLLCDSTTGRFLPIIRIDDIFDIFLSRYN
jgi:hypothetical protein